MQHSLLQKFLQNNEPWLPRALALVAAYLLARGLFLGVGGMFFLGLFCLASVLFGALLNAVYGRLPPCPPTPPAELSDWAKWGISMTYLGKSSKTAAEYEINEKRMYRNVAYLSAVGFIAADIIDALFGTIRIFSETALESFLHWLFLLSSCFVLCSHSFRTCRSFRFWLSNEIYWIKCLYLFLFFFILAAVLLMAAISEEGKGMLYSLLFNILLALPFLLIYYLSYYCLVRIGDKTPWVKPFYMSLFSLVLLAVLFAIFSVEISIIKFSLVIVFGVLSVIFMSCVRWLTRNKK